MSNTNGGSMKTISLKLPADLHAKLIALARRRSVAKSSVVRDALESYLHGKQRAGGASCAELAGDLAGCLEGPSDLAANPKHLADYGR